MIQPSGFVGRTQPSKHSAAASEKLSVCGIPRREGKLNAKGGNALSNDLVIKNARLINEGTLIEGDLAIESGRIAQIGGTLSATKEIDADGSWLVPGMIDDQVHFREPGFEHKGNIATESRAAIAGEDARFCSHHGFDFKAMASAAYRNAQGGRIRGGSTISQQTAKNAFLFQGGGYIRKAFEAWFTFLIETLWGKRRIMEVYLNIAETGIGTYGANAGAMRYFGHDASHLSPTEAARLQRA